jgi:hypothetical protein
MTGARGNMILIANLRFSFRCFLRGHELHWWSYYGDGSCFSYAYCPHCMGLFLVPMNYETAQLYGFEHWAGEPYK